MAAWVLMPLLNRLIALWFTGHFTGGTYKMRKQEAQMKHIATMALMLNLGVASVYAQQNPVKMTFSGTAGASAINLQQPGTQYRRREFRRERYAGPIHLS